MTSPLGTRFESDAASPGFMLWRVTNRWQALMRRTLAPFDLTHVQFVLLAALTFADQPEGMTQADLAQAVRADPMMVSQVVRALEAKGYLERRRDPADGRAWRVSPTPGGMSLARDANAAVEDADETFFGSAAAEAASLLAHLTRLDAGD